MEKKDREITAILDEPEILKEVGDACMISLGTETKPKAVKVTNDDDKTVKIIPC